MIPLAQKNPSHSQRPHQIRVSVPLLPLALASLVLLARLLAPPSASAALPQGVASGETSPTSTLLWARGTAPGAITFELSTDPDLANPRTFQTTVLDPSETAKVEVDALTPATRYYYRATDPAGQSDLGTFKTPAPAGTASGLRFGVSGDWRGDLAPYPSVRNTIPGQPAAGLDFFVGLGDTIYADVPSPILPGVTQAISRDEFRSKHAEVYSVRHGANFLGDLRKSTSVWTVIDDHEVTNDFAGYGVVPDGPTPHPLWRSPPGTRINDSATFETALQVFQEWNPIRPQTYSNTGADPRMDGEIKLYRHQTYGQDAAIFLTDARSFRDPGLPAAVHLNQLSVLQFLAASNDPSRTMLGQRQLADLKTDLQAAQNAGVTWKFVMTPEPIQNLGVVAASDRFEGYAAERTDLLRFIHEQGIDNVVFVAADFHGTLVNNLTYATALGAPQIKTGAFEVVTGAVAYDKPFGPTIFELAFGLGLPGALHPAIYDALPPQQKTAFLTNLINQQIAQFGYDPLGLQGSPIPATLLEGDYVAADTYGWTEFQIDPLSQELLVTTWGIPSYDPAAAAAGTTLNLQPTIVSQFRVAPVPEPTTISLMLLAASGLAWLARRTRQNAA